MESTKRMFVRREWWGSKRACTGLSVHFMNLLQDDTFPMYRAYIARDCLWFLGRVKIKPMPGTRSADRQWFVPKGISCVQKEGA